MGTKHKGTASEIQSLDAFIKLQRAADTLGSLVVQTLKDASLTEGQFAVLEMLYHLGPQDQNQIGARMLRTGANTTYLVDRMEGADLIRRNAKPGDRRCSTVELTDRGYELISKIFPGQAKQIEEAMSVLTEEELTQLGQICKKLGLSAKEKLDELRSNRKSIKLKEEK